jgi:ureidoacrylate peracid hydrolase
VAESLDPRRTAVIFFDMLKGYHYDKQGKALLPEDKPLADACAKLANTARQLGVPIFYGSADHRPDRKDASPVITDLDLRRPDPPPGGEGSVGGGGVVHGSFTSEVIDEIKPQPGDYDIRKHRWSAFHQTELDLSLRARDIDTVIIAGGSTEVGVGSTAYSARDLDYNVIVVKDATHSGRGQKISDYYVDEVVPGLGRVRTVDQIIAMLKSPTAAGGN